MIQLTRDVVNRIDCEYIEPRFGIIVVIKI